MFWVATNSCFQTGFFTGQKCYFFTSGPNNNLYNSFLLSFIIYLKFSFNISSKFVDSYQWTPWSFIDQKRIPNPRSVPNLTLSPSEILSISFKVQYQMISSFFFLTLRISLSVVSQTHPCSAQDPYFSQFYPRCD